METNTTRRRMPLFRRGKAIIATLAALTAIAGGVQALAPAPAVAMRTQCAWLYKAAQDAYGWGNYTRGDELFREWVRCEHDAETEEYPWPV